MLNSVREAGHAAPWFGLFDWPSLVPRDAALGRAAGAVHLWLAWAFCAALALHISAALWHAFVRRDDVLARMWPARAAAKRLSSQG